MCPHTAIYVSSYNYVSAYYYTCVLILLYRRPHTAICVSSYHYTCVLIRTGWGLFSRLFSMCEDMDGIADSLFVLACVCLCWSVWGVGWVGVGGWVSGVLESHVRCGVCVCVCVCLCFCVYVSLSLSLSVCFSLSLSLSLSVFVSLALYLMFVVVCVCVRCVCVRARACVRVFTGMLKGEVKEAVLERMPVFPGQMSEIKGVAVCARESELVRVRVRGGGVGERGMERGRERL